MIEQLWLRTLCILSTQRLLIFYHSFRLFFSELWTLNGCRVRYPNQFHSWSKSFSYYWWWQGSWDWNSQTTKISLLAYTAVHQSIKFLRKMIGIIVWFFGNWSGKQSHFNVRGKLGQQFLMQGQHAGRREQYEFCGPSPRTDEKLLRLFPQSMGYRDLILVCLQILYSY